MTEPVEIKISLQDVERIREQAKSEGYRDGNQYGQQSSYNRGETAAYRSLWGWFRETVTKAELEEWLREQHPSASSFLPGRPTARDRLWYRHGDVHDDPGGPCARCAEIDGQA